MNFHGDKAEACAHCGNYFFARALRIHQHGCRDKAAMEAAAAAVESAGGARSGSAEDRERAREAREARRQRERTRRQRASQAPGALRVAEEATRRAQRHDAACARAGRLRGQKARWAESEPQRAARRRGGDDGSGGGDSGGGGGSLGDHRIAGDWGAGTMGYDRGVRKFQGIRARPGLLQLDRQALRLDDVYVGHRKDGAFHLTNRAGADVYVQLNMAIELHKRYRVGLGDFHGRVQLQGEPGGDPQEWPTPWARVADGATVRVAVALRVANADFGLCTVGPAGHVDEISIDVSLAPNGHDGGARRAQRMPVVLHFRENNNAKYTGVAPPRQVVLKHCFPAGVTVVEDPRVHPKGDQQVSWRHGHACTARAMDRRPRGQQQQQQQQQQQRQPGLRVPTATHTQNGASRIRNAPVEFGAQKRGLTRSVGGRFFDK
jgi:hypothetical protein